MRVFRREEPRAGSVAAAVDERRRNWLPALFGARLQRLPSTEHEPWGLLLLGPLEIALGFRLSVQQDDAVAFDLAHGPFETFRYEAVARRDGREVRVNEKIALALPPYYGGDIAAGWIARLLASGFAEAPS